VPRLVAAAYPTVDVEGVDLSPEMIARATSTANRTRTSNLRFRVGDVAALPFADNSVDLVVSTLSLHHWDDPAAGLDEIVRVLGPGGQAWIYDFRTALTATQRTTSGLDADVALESPLIGTTRLNPIGPSRPPPPTTPHLACLDRIAFQSRDRPARGDWASQRVLVAQSLADQVDDQLVELAVEIFTLDRSPTTRTTGVALQDHRRARRN
jgi:SAM-dependent methyltransferase